MGITRVAPVAYSWNFSISPSNSTKNSPRFNQTQSDKLCTFPCRQIVRFVETPSAENAAHHFLEFADDVRLQNVFVRLVRGEEESGTAVVEVTLVRVVFFHVDRCTSLRQ